MKLNDHDKDRLADAVFEEIVERCERVVGRQFSEQEYAGLEEQLVDSLREALGDLDLPGNEA